MVCALLSTCTNVSRTWGPSVECSRRRSTLALASDVFRKENVDNMVVKFQPLINDTSSIILEINISRWSTVMRLTSVQVQGELPAHQDFALAQKLGFGRCATCGALL